MLFDVVAVVHILHLNHRRPNRRLQDSERSRLRREIQIRFHAYCNCSVFMAKREVKGGLLDCCNRRRLELLLFGDDTSVVMSNPDIQTGSKI